MNTTNLHVCVRVKPTDAATFQKIFISVSHVIAEQLNWFGTVTIALYFSEKTQYYYVVFTFTSEQAADKARGRRLCQTKIGLIAEFTENEQLDPKEELPEDVERVTQ